MKAPTLVLVVPCYNEARRLTPEAFVDFVQSQSGAEVLFIDDGSSDATPAMLDEVVSRAPEKLTVMRLAANVGKAHAVQLGIRAALSRQAEFVGFWDADLSTPLAAVHEFLDVFYARPGVDIVIGARVRLLGRHIRRKHTRHYAGRVFATAASLVLRLPVYDTQCGAKIFRVTDAVHRVFQAPFRSQWIFDIEILSRYTAIVGVEQAQERISELPLYTWTDVSGSKLTLRHALRAAWDFIRVARR